MATLEQILDETRRLPADEQRRLRDELDALQANGGGAVSRPTHESERAWIEQHRGEYLEQWVVLDGGNLIAHGSNALTVYDEARNGIGSNWPPNTAMR